MLLSWVSICMMMNINVGADDELRHSFQYLPTFWSFWSPSVQQKLITCHFCFRFQYPKSGFRDLSFFEDIQISSEASNTNIQIFAITSSLSFSGLFPLAPGPRSIQHSASQWCCWRRKISWEPLHGQPWCPAWNLHARLTFLGVPLQELKPWQQSRPCLIALPSQLAFKTQ